MRKGITPIIAIIILLLITLSLAASAWLFLGGYAGTMSSGIIMVSSVYEGNGAAVAYATNMGSSILTAEDIVLMGDGEEIEFTLNKVEVQPGDSGYVFRVDSAFTEPNWAAVPAGPLKDLVQAGYRKLHPPPGDRVTGGETEFERGTGAELNTGIDHLRPDLRSFVARYSDSQYDKMGGRAYLSADKNSGFYVKPDGELISVFSTIPGRGDDIVQAAVKVGASKLDCFEDVKNRHLPRLYYSNGFYETERIQWDDKYAPAGWDYEKRNRPPVVYMRKG